MTINFNQLTAVNFVLCIIILIIGLFGYKKNKAALYIGAAFALFGVSHFFTLTGIAANFEGVLIAVRTVAYFLVIVALYKITFKD